MNINERNRIMVTMTAVFAVIGLVSFFLTIRKDSNTTVAPPTTAASAATSSTPTSIPVMPTEAPTNTSPVAVPNPTLKTTFPTLTEADPSISPASAPAPTVQTGATTTGAGTSGSGTASGKSTDLDSSTLPSIEGPTANASPGATAASSISIANQATLITVVVPDGKGESTVVALCQKQLMIGVAFSTELFRLYNGFKSAPQLRPNQTVVCEPGGPNEISVRGGPGLTSSSPSPTTIPK